MKRKILVDTDPGGDDIVALLWLQSLVKKNLAELVAVTTVEGNVPAKLTFANASKILHLCGCDAVEIGRSVPFEPSEIDNASHIHGADGIGNLSETLPEPDRRFDEARIADELIIETLESAPGEITLIGLAPLTNLAAAEEKQPGILKLAKEVVLMAGAFNTPGNVTSEAEFNVAFNPEAAQQVFQSRDDIVVLPLDVTRQLILTVDKTQAIANRYCDCLLAQFTHKLSLFMTNSCLQHRETEGKLGFLVHDAVAIAYLFYPETLRFRRACVNVETRGEFTRGKTLFDDRHVPKHPANAFVAMEVDAVNLLAILIEDLKSLFGG